MTARHLFLVVLATVLAAAPQPRAHADTPVDAPATAPTVTPPADDLGARLATRHGAQVDAARWAPPTAPQHTALAAFVDALAAALPDCAAPGVDRAVRQATVAGYRVERWIQPGGGDVLVAWEVDPAGGVMLAVRCGAMEGHADVLLQAPHALFDLDTDDVVRDAFVAGGVRAAMWNTVHRYRAVPGEQPYDPVHPADVAHEPASLFQTATLGWLAARPTARVVQIHGFGRASVDGDAVISSGTPRRPPTSLRAPVAAALGLSPERVRIFGDDADALGATTNVTGRQLVGAHPARFLHVELSRRVRDALAASPERSAALVVALGDAPWPF